MEGFLDLFRQALKDKCETIENRLLSGGVDTFETYKFLVGELKGLTDSDDLLTKAYKDYLNLGDDD